MKRVKSRQEVDTLYILGAGASYALSFINPQKNKPLKKTVTPLDKDFLNCINKSKPTNGWKKESVELLDNGWLDNDFIFDLGLEQAIIKRVSQYEFLSNLNSERTRKKCNNEDFLNNLTHLVTAYLMKCRSNSSGQTKTFVNRAFPIGIKPEEYKNRIITFNYDTLIDKHLIERGLSIKKIYFDRIVKSKDEGTRREYSQKFMHPLILKLHGSINWRCDRNHFDEMIIDSSNKLDKDEKFAIWFDDKNIPKPNDVESPLIIPPIPNKPITRSSLFKFLWTTAFEYMHQAKRIVIVGYSCPNTDTLARAMFTHFTTKHLEEIIIVDPNVLALKNYRDMISEVASKKVKWKYYGSFSEYIEGES